MKRLIWAVKYFYYMNKQIRNIRFSAYWAKVAYFEYEDWDIDTPKDAVFEELSCWHD